VTEERHGTDDKAAQMQMTADVEEAVGRLYEAYADLFPAHEEFWSGLEIEQGDRASTIFDLIRKVGNGTARFDADSARMREAEKLLVRVEEELKRADDQLAFKEALETALDIEKTLAGHRFYGMFDGTGTTRRAIETLDESATNHVDILRLELKHHYQE
jgi:hypothetical protein